MEKLVLESDADAVLRQDQILDGLVRLTDVQVEQLENLLTLTDKGMPWVRVLCKPRRPMRHHCWCAAPLPGAVRRSPCQAGTPRNGFGLLTTTGCGTPLP